nr:hypothetical protein [Tanacetum cinerariifolium]
YNKTIVNKIVNTIRVKDTAAKERAVKEYKEKGVIDGGCSRHMIGTKFYVTNYKDYDGGFVSIRDGKGRISGKGKIKTGTLDFDDVYFYKEQGIKREFSVARTPQQNGITKKKNRTLIEAARTMALVIKPHNKTPYELIHRRPPLIDFMKPFGCPVTILYTRDHLGKFDGKADEGFFLSGNRPDWFFDIDSLTISINYEPVVAGKQTNGIAGTKDNIVAGQAKKKKEPKQEYILIPIYTTNPLISQGPKNSVVDAGKKATEVDESRVLDNGGQDDLVTRSEFERLLQQERQTEHINNTNSFNTISSPVVTPPNWVATE